MHKRPEDCALTPVSQQTGQQWHLRGKELWLETTNYTRLLRIDLASGKTETWLNAVANVSMEIVGFESTGVPWVVLGAELYRITAPGSKEPIFTANGPLSEALTNRYGTWFAVVDNVSPVPGLYVFNPGSGVKMISTLPVLPA